MIEKQFVISVKGKIAELVNGGMLVCGNNDYKIEFDFDEAWDNHNTKTALFVFGNQTIYKVFDGNICDGVVVENATKCYIGVFSGDLITSTYAAIPCLMSIRDLGGVPKEPTKEVYDQIIDLINEYIQGGGGGSGGSGFSPTIEIVPIDGGHQVIITDVTGAKVFEVMNGVDGEDGYTPIKGVDYWTEADKEEIAQEVGNNLANRFVERIDTEAMFVRAYAVDETGAQDTVSVDTVTRDGIGENNVPRRNANLGIYIPNAPEDDDEAANKAYVDGKFQEVIEMLGEAEQLITMINEGGLV